VAAKRPGARRKSKVERYDQILAAAAKVFSEESYKAATIHRIAAELDMTGAALYHYVDSKETLLVDICARAGNKLVATARAVQALDLPPEERLRQIFHRHLELLIEERPAFTILINERSEVPRDWVGEFVEGERTYLAAVREILEELSVDGADVRLAALSMMGTLNWALRWFREDGTRPLCEIADELYSTFLRGFMRAPGNGGADCRVRRPAPPLDTPSASS
jgi:AcrR family transcriptional regulator